MSGYSNSWVSSLCGETVTSFLVSTRFTATFAIPLPLYKQQLNKILALNMPKKIMLRSNNGNVCKISLIKFQTLAIELLSRLKNSTSVNENRAMHFVEATFFPL